jgi:S1-C subfamily serine protease
VADDRPIDILLSYKSEERAIAEQLAHALAQRWNVWWDNHLLAGDAYRKIIGEKLALTRCVVVLWSRRSVESDFVLDEAQRALRRGVLIPVRIEAVDVPLGFGQQDYTDLIGWDGDQSHPGFQELCSSIAQRLGTPVAAAIPPSPRASWARLVRRRAPLLAGSGLLLLALVAFAFSRRSSPPPADTPGNASAPAAAAAVRNEATPGQSIAALKTVQVSVDGQVIAAGTLIPSGLVVTPCHVVGDARVVTLSGAGAWNGPATVVERRCDVDLLLLQPARGPILPNAVVVRFAGSLAKGDPIERYRGESDRTPGTVISPSVSMSYLGDEQRKMRLLVTTNVAAGGDSGAAILDGQGRIVGLLVAGDGATQSLAIPTETIRETFINRFAP